MYLVLRWIHRNKCTYSVHISASAPGADLRISHQRWGDPSSEWLNLPGSLSERWLDVRAGQCRWEDCDTVTIDSGNGMHSYTPLEAEAWLKEHRWL